jgi:hypothetical protein
MMKTDYKQPYIDAMEHIRALQRTTLQILAKAAVPARPNPNCFFCGTRKPSRFVFLHNGGIRFQVGVCTECTPNKNVLKQKPRRTSEQP